MEKRLVYHHNLIGHEINESRQLYADDVLDREVYCRKLHVIKEPQVEDCKDCPYYEGLEQGHGHECVWEDVTDLHYVVQHEDRYKEYERVDKLMKKGIIENAENKLVEKVQNGPYDESIWIYEQSEDIKNRFLLGTKGNKTLVCCGVNPSYASPRRLDPTMRRVESFAKAMGYDSYIMINLYPMRATDPKELHEEMDKQIVKKNLELIISLLKNGDYDIWAAWGVVIETKDYLKECLRQIVDIADTYNCNWYTIGGRTKSGHPRHPSRLSGESCMEAFDVHTYLKTMQENL